MALLGEAFASSQAIFALRKAMLAAYGPDGWYVFRDGDGFGFELPLAALARIDDDDVDVHGTVAQCPIGDQDSSMLARVIRDAGGQWRIEASSLAPGRGDPKAMLETQRKITEMVRQLTNKAGAPGVTPAQLDKEAMGFFFKKKE